MVGPVNVNLTGYVLSHIRKYGKTRLYSLYDNTHTRTHIQTHTFPYMYRPTYIRAVPMKSVTFIHSFIHSEDLYSASSRDYYSEALPAQPRTKKKDLREM